MQRVHGPASMFVLLPSTNADSRTGQGIRDAAYACLYEHVHVLRRGTEWRELWGKSLVAMAEPSTDGSQGPLTVHIHCSREPRLACASI